MKYKTIGEIRYVGSVHQKYVFVNIEHHASDPPLRVHQKAL